MKKVLVPANPKEFDNEFKKVFSKTSFKTLFSSTIPRLRFDMGGNKKGGKRIEQVVKRSYEIISYVLKGRPFWIRMTIWDKIGDGKMTDNFINYKVDKLGFQITKGIYKFKRKEANSIVVYLYFNKSFPFNKIKSLLKSIANREIGLMETADVTAYFIRFTDCPVVIDLYDDRGMDLIQISKNELKEVFNTYKSMIFEYDLERIKNIFN